MSKAMGSWSAMRKYLEEEMLCPVLKGRIRYACCPHGDGWGMFELFCDGISMAKFAGSHAAKQLNAGKRPEDVNDFWATYWMDRQMPAGMRTPDDADFAQALACYRNQSIEVSLDSSDPVVRMFAILDRRIGKRTLERMKNDIPERPEWLRRIYLLRYNVET